MQLDPGRVNQVNVRAAVRAMMQSVEDSRTVLTLRNDNACGTSPV